jgi:hypothetical protein
MIDRRHRVRRAAVALLLVLVCSTHARAQTGIGIVQDEPWYIGASGSVSLNHHALGGRRLDSCSCPAFGDGEGKGRQGGIAARAMLSPIVGIDARVVYDPRPARFTVRRDESVLLEGSNEVGTGRSSAMVDVEYTLLTTEAVATLVLGRLDIVALTISAGPSFGVLLDARSSQFHDLLEPAGSRFRNPEGYPTEVEGKRLLVSTDRPLEEVSTTRVGLKAGLGFDVLPVERILMRIGAYYDRSLTDVSTDDGWTMHSSVFQIDVLFEL